MITIKTDVEIGIMREGGKILACVLVALKSLAKPGVALSKLDKLAEQLIREAGAKPSFKGYRPSGAVKPYPASVCLSVNDEVVHGLPDERILKDGDLLKIDLGVFYKGLHTDSAVTIPTGNVSQEAKELISVTERALELAVKMVRPGVHLGDIGEVIQKFVASHNFSVVRDLVGHGIGRELQEEPMVPNFGKEGTGVVLEEGMTIAIEPMVAAGKGHLILAADGFTYKTADGSLAAHFEHTVAVTKDGCVILTKF